MAKHLKLYARDKELLAGIKDLLSKDLEHMPSLHALSQQSGMNRDKLKKGFKLLYGMPVEAYHRFLRMEEAKRLLTDPEKTIREIAWLVGYERSQSFGAAFKRVTGMSAGEWRKREG